MPSAGGSDGLSIRNVKVVEKPPATGCRTLYHAEPTWPGAEVVSCRTPLVLVAVAVPFNTRFVVELKFGKYGLWANSGVAAIITRPARTTTAKTLAFVLLNLPLHSARVQDATATAIKLSS